MRAAMIGIVQHECIARLEAWSVPRNHGAHRVAHAAEMDGNMRRIGDQPAVSIEERAGEIHALFDIDRMGGVGQHRSHLLCHRHE